MKKIIILFTILMFTILIFCVFANDDEEKLTLQQKIHIYNQLLSQAKEASLDTSDAEKVMNQAKTLLSSGFADGADTLVDSAIYKLIKKLQDAGIKGADAILTPSAELTPGINISRPTSTPLPDISLPTPYNMKPDSHDKNPYLGGNSLLMMEELPVCWIKPDSAQLKYNSDDKGNYNWEQLDRFYSQACRYNVNLIVNISGMKALPKDKDGYMRFIRTAVERYDGDGMKDAPFPIKIKYFQLGDEMDSSINCYGQKQWNDTAENYALLLRWTRQAIRDSNGEGQLILGGSSSYEAWAKYGELDTITGKVFEKDGWFVTLLDTLDSLERNETDDDSIKLYFDGVDFHNYGGGVTSGTDVNLSYKPLDFGIDLMKKRLYEYKYNNVSIWIFRNSIYTGTPVASQVDKTFYIPVSEKEQAVYLIKSFILSISKGCKSVFWSTFLDDVPGETLHYGVKDSFYSYSGLLNNDHTKKLSFYSLRLLSDLLRGAKYNRPFTGLNPGVYGYAFVKDNSPFYIFWYDGKDKTTVHISSEQGKIYNITSFITEHDGITKTRTIRADNGLLTFELSGEPVFVKQK